MKHLKTFEGHSNVELTNEEEIWGLFKSGESKGFAIATQGNNFAMYVQQALDTRAVRDGRPLPRMFGDQDLSHLTKGDFLKFAELMKKLDFDYKAIKGAVKADKKLEDILDYICGRGYSTASHTSAGKHQFGSGEGPNDRYQVNTELDPIEAVEKCRERKPEAAKVAVDSKVLPPKGKFESVRYKRK